MVPAPAGHIALWRTGRRRRLLLLGFLPAAPQNSKVAPCRRRGLEPLRARGAAGELRGAQHRPAESGHTAPRAPVAAASRPGASAFPRRRGSEQQPTGARGRRGGGYARGAPLRGEAPVPVAEPATISLPAFPAEGGGSKGGGDVAGEESRPNFIYERLLEFIGSCLSRGAGITHGSKAAGAGASGCPRSSGASLRTIPSTRGCLLGGGQERN